MAMTLIHQLLISLFVSNNKALFLRLIVSPNFLRILKRVSCSVAFVGPYSIFSRLSFQLARLIQWLKSNCTKRAFRRVDVFMISLHYAGLIKILDSLPSPSQSDVDEQLRSAEAAR